MQNQTQFASPQPQRKQFQNIIQNQNQLQVPGQGQNRVAFAQQIQSQFMPQNSSQLNQQHQTLHKQFIPAVSQQFNPHLQTPGNQNIFRTPIQGSPAVNPSLFQSLQNPHQPHQLLHNMQLHNPALDRLEEKFLSKENLEIIERVIEKRDFENIKTLIQLQRSEIERWKSSCLYLEKNYTQVLNKDMKIKELEERIRIKESSELELQTKVNLLQARLGSKQGDSRDFNESSIFKEKLNFMEERIISKENEARGFQESYSALMSEYNMQISEKDRIIKDLEYQLSNSDSNSSNQNLRAILFTLLERFVIMAAVLDSFIDEDKGEKQSSSNYVSVMNGSQWKTY